MPIVFGKDSADNVLPLLLDASGRIIVDGESPSLFRPVSISSQFSNIVLPAGNSRQTVFTVPFGQAWRITSYSYIYIGTVVGLTLILGMDNTSTSMYFELKNPVVNSVYYFTVTNILFTAGHKFFVDVLGATLNNDIYVNFFGERIY